MSTPDRPDDQGVPPQWEALLRQMLGADADAVLREIAERGGLPGMTDAQGNPVDLGRMAAAAGLPDDPAALGQVFGRVQRMFAAAGDEPVNWEIANDLARQAAVTEGDPSVNVVQRRETTEAFHVAELWLDQATELPAAGGAVHVWSRSEWVQSTMPAWRSLAEPIAEHVADALATVLAGQADDVTGPDPFGGAGDLSGLLAGASQMMRRVGGAVFGMQVGQAAGTLAREVFGATDIGLPLLPGAGAALVPRNVAAFAEGLDVPVDEVRLFLALREVAHARLFAHVSWLRGHLLGAVDAYARGITIDMESLEESVRSIDPTDPAALQEAMSGGVFAPQTTPAQQAALARLETALALVEGWVDEVTAAAAAPHLPHTAALREMLRRRRAAGGPAEDTFATLVGLELRPRRSRDAARLWAQIAADGGTAARDGIWDHPDLMPTAEDLDDPTGYARRRAADRTDHADVDRALAEIFGEDTSDAEGATDAEDGADGPEPDKG
jgi:putative hydrolase